MHVRNSGSGGEFLCHRSSGDRRCKYAEQDVAVFCHADVDTSDQRGAGQIRLAGSRSGIYGIGFHPEAHGLASGFCAGTAYAFLRKLGNRGERGPVIVFFFSAFSTIVAAPFLIFDYHPMTMMQIIFLLLASLGGLGGQLSITAAYRSAPAKEISVFDYSQVIFAAFLGIILFGEVPDRWSLLGYVMIIGVAILRWYFAKEADIKHHNTGHDA